MTVRRYPRSWYSTVTVVRSGRDEKGRPTQGVEIERAGVLVAPRATSDPVDRSDVTANTAVLYDADTSFRYHVSDRIVVPEGERMAGTWRVDGRPAEWPSGTEVRLIL